MRQFPRVLRPSEPDSPSRRNSRKENYASYRAHAALSKASSLNTSAGPGSLLLKKKSSAKDAPVSSSLLAGSSSGRPKLEKLPSSSSQSSAR